MALLAEYALTPDVFDSTCYSNDEVGTIRLQYLKEALLADGLVRNLRNGGWLQVFGNNSRPWHKRGTELLKKLTQQNRMRHFAPMLSNEPTDDVMWCEEALASHRMLPVAGVISTDSIAAHHCSDPIVCSISRLSGAPWWTGRSPSVRLARTRQAYEDNLQTVMRCANSLMLIDPHLDPSRPQYRDTMALLGAAAGRNPAPLIEVHRACYVGSGPNRQIVANSEWQERFSNVWTHDLQSCGLRVDVFVWDEFHDRYLISDLIGIAMLNGYDTTSDTTDLTTWMRLGRNERDDVQREFDLASSRHVLRHHFSIP